MKKLSPIVFIISAFLWGTASMAAETPKAAVEQLNLAIQQGQEAAANTGIKSWFFSIFRKTRTYRKYPLRFKKG